MYMYALHAACTCFPSLGCPPATVWECLLQSAFFQNPKNEVQVCRHKWYLSYMYHTYSDRLQSCDMVHVCTVFNNRPHVQSCHTIPPVYIYIYIHNVVFLCK